MSKRTETDAMRKAIQWGGDWIQILHSDGQPKSYALGVGTARLQPGDIVLSVVVSNGLFSYDEYIPTQSMNCLLIDCRP